MCEFNRSHLKRNIDTKLVFLWGVVLGALLIILIIPKSSDLHKLAIQELKNCEQSLPRDQFCKLTAIVSDNKNNDR